MKDLISRQAAIEAIDKYFDDIPIQVFYDMVQIITNLPTINAVPVVRCKDCKWSTNEPYRGDDVWICNFNHWRRSQGKREPDFFCADGERREE